MSGVYRGRRKSGQKIRQAENESELERDAPERLLLLAFLSRRLAVFHRRHGFTQGGAKAAGSLHIDHSARRHQQAPVDRETDVDEMIDLVRTTEGGELRAIFRDAFVADGNCGRRKVQSFKTSGDIRGVVGARRDGIVPQPLKLIEDRIGRGGEISDARITRESDGAPVSGQV